MRTPQQLYRDIHTKKAPPVHAEKESDIQKACTDMLLLDGWRVVHTDLKHLRGMGVQEPGIADDLFIRYENIPPWSAVVTEKGQLTRTEVLSRAQVMFIEWKRIDPRGLRTKASQKQRDWHTLERKRGALTLIAGQDFEPTTEGFRTFYKNSGLMRNKIL